MVRMLLGTPPGRQGGHPQLVASLNKGVCEVLHKAAMRLQEVVPWPLLWL